MVSPEPRSPNTGEGVSDTEGSVDHSRRRILGATAGGLSLAALGTTAAASTPVEGETVTFVHDTHFHGRFGNADEPNIARYQTEVTRQLDSHENALFLGNGDDLAPSILGLTYEGEHMIEALNYMSPAAVGVGNHEFDFGVDVATERFQESSFPWVVANLLTPDREPIPGTERWTTVDAGDVTVGVFGCGVEDFHGITDYPDEYIALDPVEASQEATEALRDAGADVVVMASHTDSSTHVDIAEAVDLDLIVGSHSGIVFDEPREVNGTVISEVGDQFHHMGVVTLDAANGDLANWERVDLDAEIEPDSGMEQIVDKWKSDLEDELGSPHFTTGEPLDATFDTNYGRESRFGNLMCDTMRAIGDADVALQNSGGIRSNTVYGPGPITGLDVLDILPFPNIVEVIEISGSDLKALLESQVRSLPQSSFGAQPSVQVSGIQYEWTGQHGERSVDNVYVGSEPLDENETYALATNDYVGGWDRLQDLPRLMVTDHLQGPLVLDALEEMGHVDPSIEHRMLRVDEDVGESRDVSNEGGYATVTFTAPDGLVRAYGTTFHAVTRFGHSIQAKDVSVSSGDVEVTFEEDALRLLSTGVSSPDLRVLGGFEPDSEHYSYENDDGDLLDLPASAAYEYFVMKGTVRLQGRA